MSCITQITYIIMDHDRDNYIPCPLPLELARGSMISDMDQASENKNEYY